MEQAYLIYHNTGFQLLEDRRLVRLVESGQHYRTEEVVDLLSRPTKQPVCAHEQNCLLDDAYFPFYERHNTGLPTSQVLYNGGHYYQGDEPTCLPWTIANAFRVSGITPPPAVLRDLLNNALERTGLHYDEAQKPLGSHSINLQILDDKYALGRGDADPIFGISSKQHQHNTEVIKGFLDSGIPLLISMVAQYRTDLQHKYHAMCIAGYRISERGYMNVQLLDPSNRVILGSSLEMLEKDIRQTAVLRF